MEVLLHEAPRVTSHPMIVQSAAAPGRAVIRPESQTEVVVDAESMSTVTWFLPTRSIRAGRLRWMAILALWVVGSGAYAMRRRDSL